MTGLVVVVIVKTAKCRLLSISNEIFLKVQLINFGIYFRLFNEE